MTTDERLAQIEDTLDALFDIIECIHTHVTGHGDDADYDGEVHDAGPLS